jgi:ABC-type glycerol-3-phosphate transport system substrate-binding protein
MQFKSNVTRKINRRNFLKLAGLTGAGTILASCTSQETPTEAEEAPVDEEAAEEEVEAPPAEKIPLSFWTPGGSDVYCQGFDTIAANYMAENPNILIETPTQCNPTGENYTEVLLANIAAGTPPDSTIVWTSPVTYAVRNAVLPLDDYMNVSKYSNR